MNIQKELEKIAKTGMNPNEMELIIKLGADDFIHEVVTYQFNIIQKPLLLKPNSDNFNKLKKAIAEQKVAVYHLDGNVIDNIPFLTREFLEENNYSYQDMPTYFWTPEEKQEYLIDNPIARLYINEDLVDFEEEVKAALYSVETLELMKILENVHDEHKSFVKDYMLSLQDKDNEEDITWMASIMYDTIQELKKEILGSLTEDGQLLAIRAIIQAKGDSLTISNEELKDLPVFIVLFIAAHLPCINIVELFNESDIFINEKLDAEKIAVLLCNLELQYSKEGKDITQDREIIDRIRKINNIESFVEYNSKKLFNII